MMKRGRTISTFLMFVTFSRPRQNCPYLISAHIFDQLWQHFFIIYSRSSNNAGGNGLVGPSDSLGLTLPRSGRNNRQSGENKQLFYMFWNVASCNFTFTRAENAWFFRASWAKPRLFFITKVKIQHNGLYFY